ncbi:hypothetical protein JK205_07315 [Gluconobacter cerinus]|uniref:hypothetical protein n=1 Tax=Gluconobacter cerinus TaxID=38307 RepID=UPI001B8BCA67|nr:hypothetical protein [Gluconobacter cerinus]MBS1018738.1 hypothetical protein [Gluconobacter cerinus]
MKASYASTGGSGIDYEVDLAAALLARLLAGGADALYLPSIEPEGISLQHRSGPRGFDDITVRGKAQNGSGTVAYLQAKRSYALGDTADFRGLLAAIHQQLQIDPGSWTATIVTASSTPTARDIDEVLGSARAQSDGTTFDALWAEEGVLNDAKRQFLAAITSGLPAASPSTRLAVLQRLRLVIADFDIEASRNRQDSIDLIARSLTDPSRATDLFASLRSTALTNGKLAGSFTRISLLSRLPDSYGLLPGQRFRDPLARLESASGDALSTIVSHLSLPEPTPTGLSLLRNDLLRAGLADLRAHRTLRIVGDGGVGKSALLRRIAARFDGPTLALKDDRVDARSWSTYTASLGLSVTVEQAVDELAGRGECLLVIDGADRLLLSNRRPVVLDLFRAIADSPLGVRWSILTSARDFQTRDVVSDALTEVGLPTGRRLVVSSVTSEDVWIIGQALPALRSVAARSDLGDRNRVLFLYREMLASQQLGDTATEVQLAEAWATRGLHAQPADPRRDAALSRIGTLLLRRTDQPPTLADLDPEGYLSLQREDTIRLAPGHDRVLLAHDIHEDWLLARAFFNHEVDLPALLQQADEPLAWLRAMRVYGQTLLEGLNGTQAWRAALARLDAVPELDPAWARSLLTAPLYSERSLEILRELEPLLLADDARLLTRLLDTLLVAEMRLVEAVPTQAGSGPTVQHHLPIYRSWLNFLRWSVRLWRAWPPAIYIQLARIGHCFCAATQGVNWSIIRAVVQESLTLLMEIEDCEHGQEWRDWDNRRRPFGENGHRDWDETEKLLRNAIARGAAAAPEEVTTYLRRLQSDRRWKDPAGDLIEHHGQIPAVLPGPYVDLLIAYFLPRERKPRHENMLFFQDCFAITNYHEAGIRNAPTYIEAAPSRYGFDAIFEKSETDGLRLFHRLEMRASVYLRHFHARREHNPLNPLRVPTPWGVIPLWGNEHEYKWSRALLGSDVLGSCYFALDDWLWAQIEAGRDIKELARLVLQAHGLAATASLLINAIALRADTPGVIDAAAPFLATPRLWDYDLMRFIETQTYAHPISFRPRDHHFKKADIGWQRWRRRTFLQRDLLLGFQVQAGEAATALLAAARETWTVDDLAVHLRDLGNPEHRRALEERLGRIRSDTDPASVRMARNKDGLGGTIWIEPSAEQTAQREKAAAHERTAGPIRELMKWVAAFELRGVLDRSPSLEQAIAKAKAIQSQPQAELLCEEDGFHLRMAQAGASATAWLAAHLGPDELFIQERDWIEATILNACQTLTETEADGMFVDEALLSMHPLLYGARGAGVLMSRGPSNPEIATWARFIAYSRLTDASVHLLRALDWTRIPSKAWDLAVIALDRCVIRSARYWGPNQNRAAMRAGRTNQRLMRQSIGARSWLFVGPRTPRKPRSTLRRGFYRSTGNWLPLKYGQHQTDWTFHWTRAGKILNELDMSAIAGDPGLFRRMDAYLRQLLVWLHDYTDAGGKRVDLTFPYEWSTNLAKAIGRFAFASGAADLWRPLGKFEESRNAERCVSQYLEALTSELIVSGRAPDAHFWAARQGASDWIFDRLGHERASDYDYLVEWGTSAGFMGPYGIPLPDDWPHLDAALPEINRWAELSLGSAIAARRLVRLAVRLDITQRQKWLLAWATAMAERRRGDQRFWTYDHLGDELSQQIEPLASSGPAVRKEVRAILSVIADAGSLIARECLARLAGQRNRG